MGPTGDVTLRSIVVGDIRTAAVLEQLGIDFCCQGERTLGDACRERGLSIDTVSAAIAAASQARGDQPVRFDTWDLPALASHIVAEHHEYVRAALPRLREHTKKIASVHGARHPELHEVSVLFAAMADELQAHLLKEERILFPYIAELVVAGGSAESPFGSVENPIRMMEREHDAAGRSMARIRALLHDYAAPDDACATYRLCLEELRAFEADLHTHVHLENNILFPRTRLLEASAR
jgi:regulator of cell morphogenesis and NO signaling